MISLPWTVFIIKTHTHTHIFQYSNGRNYAEQIIKTRRSVLPVVTTLLISIIRTRPSRLRSTHPNPKRPAIVNRWLGFWAPQLHHYRLTPPTAGNQERRPLKHEPTQARPPNPDAENLGFGRGRPPRGGENKTSGEGRETGGGGRSRCAPCGRRSPRTPGTCRRSAAAASSSPRSWRRRRRGAARRESRERERVVVGILVGFEGFGSGAGAAGVLISGSSRDAVRRERELDRLGLGRWVESSWEMRVGGRSPRGFVLSLRIKVSLMKHGNLCD